METLSDKKHNFGEGNTLDSWYNEEDVKEFIRDITLDLCALLEGEGLLNKKDIKRVYAIIEKLAGPKLT